MSGSAGSGGTVILREFLMKLGYVEDEGMRRRFLDGIKSVTNQIAGISTAVATAALGVVEGVKIMAQSMEQLYWLGQRSKSGVEEIQAFGHAFAQLGGSTQQAYGLLERFAAFLRQPGHQSYIETFIGKEEAGKSPVEQLQALGRAFNKLMQGPDGLHYGTIVSIAQRMGIGEQDLLVMLRNVDEITKKYEHMRHAILGNEDDIAKRSMQFMREYRDVVAEIAAFGERFVDKIQKALTPELQRMREYLLQHATEINEALDKIASGVVCVIEVTGGLARAAGRGLLYLKDRFLELPPSVQKVIEVIALLGLAWRAFSVAFSLTPVGAIITGIGALIAIITALYEDYHKWKSGQESFIDWGKWEPTITAATKAIGALGDIFRSTTAGVDYLVDGLWKMVKLMRGELLPAASSTVGGINGYMEGLLSRFGNWMNPEGGAWEFLPAGHTLWGMIPEKEQQRYLNSPYNQNLMNKGGHRSVPNPAALDTDPRVAQAMAMAMAAGYTEQQAAALVGGLWVESSLDPKASNDIGGGHVGIGQWGLTRQGAPWAQFLREKNRPFHPLASADFQEQFEFKLWEQSHNEAAAGGRLRAANTAEESSRAMASDERPDGYVSPENPGPVYNAYLAANEQIMRNRQRMRLPDGSMPPPKTTESAPTKSGSSWGDTWQHLKEWWSAPGGDTMGQSKQITMIDQSQHHYALGGTPDPNAAAAKVRAAWYDRGNADMLRNMQGNVA